MTTIAAINNGMYRFVGPGPHILNLPQGVQGDVVSYGTATDVPADITVNTFAGDNIRGPSGTTATSIQLGLTHEFVTLVFQDRDGLREWFIRSDFTGARNTIAEVTTPPIALGAVATLIPLQYRAGDTQLFTFTAGRATCNYTLPGRTVLIDSPLYVSMVLGANNNDIEVLTEWRLFSGTGALLPINDGGSIGHSRAYSEQSKQTPSALYTPTAGDVLELVGTIAIDTGAGNLATIEGGLANLDVTT